MNDDESFICVIIILLVYNYVIGKYERNKYKKEIGYIFFKELL